MPIHRPNPWSRARVAVCGLLLLSLPLGGCASRADDPDTRFEHEDIPESFLRARELEENARTELARSNADHAAAVSKERKSFSDKVGSGVLRMLGESMARTARTGSRVSRQPGCMAAPGCPG